MEKLSGMYMVFLALWDKLIQVDEDARARGYEGPSELCRVQCLGKTVGSCYYDSGYALEASCLGEVFERLNLDHPEDYRRRSLSVGDVVVDPVGNAWVVQGTGWKKLEPQRYSPHNDFARAAKDFSGDLKAACRARNEELEG